MAVVMDNMHSHACEAWVKLCSYNITNHLTSKFKFQLKFNAIKIKVILLRMRAHAYVFYKYKYIILNYPAGKRCQEYSCYRIVTSVYECCIVSILTGSVIIQLMSDRQLTVQIYDGPTVIASIG